MKRLIKIALITILLAPVMASAHTIAVGTANAGVAGSVTVYMTTYLSGHSGGVQNEGAITIGGTTINFGNLISSKPAALIDGVNNWFHPGSGTNFTSATNTTGRAEVHWQSATFTGLLAGNHGYTISGMNTVDWANWGTGASNWTGVLNIPNSSIQTPEPGVLALLGLGLAGLGFSRKRAKV